MNVWLDGTLFVLTTGRPGRGQATSSDGLTDLHDAAGSKRFQNQKLWMGTLVRIATDNTSILITARRHVVILDIGHPNANRVARDNFGYR